MDDKIQSGYIPSFKSLGLNFPVQTSHPYIPTYYAPQISVRMSSPIITKLSARKPNFLAPNLKNSAAGFPKTIAVLPVANSNAHVKGPTSKLGPSVSWKYVPFRKYPLTAQLWLLLECWNSNLS
eukprot:TRINITY_DN6872_c0_g1_i5.p3 TRINITY_DN6872_c0_g1~~TRINITY_DN6872_c0_g1_i5.p3  ORF type:complete len:124 (-),score=0.07 TRINITY_DN6872_c0_g1_i5:204-575(-)